MEATLEEGGDWSARHIPRKKIQKNPKEKTVWINDPRPPIANHNTKLGV
jgi:hypothetical protein